MVDLLGLTHPVDLEHELIERACICYERKPPTWALWEGLPIHSWASRYDRSGGALAWSLCDLIGNMATPFVQLEGGKDGLPLWSPTLYQEGASRGARGVAGVSMLVLDVDDGTAAAELMRPGLLCLAHTSWSHMRGEEPRQKWRVVYPLAELVPSKDWASVWRWVAQTWPMVDPSTKDASRMFYLPAVPTKPRWWERIEVGGAVDAYRVDGGVYEVRMQWGDLLEPGRRDPPAARALRRPRTFGVVPALVGAGRRGRFVEAVVRARVERIEQAGPGRRNTTVFGGAKDCAKLEAAGALVWADAVPRLMAAALACGLSEKEAHAAIESGRAGGQDEPWQFGD